MALTTFTGPVVSQNGFLDSSFTTAERDAIVNPQPGLLIYNTTVNEYQVYSGTAWGTAFGGGGGPATTYTEAVDYMSGGVYRSGSGSATNVSINQGDWSNTAGFNNLLTKGSGTVFTLIQDGVSFTFTASTGWVPNSPGAYQMTGVSNQFTPGGNITSISFPS